MNEAEDRGVGSFAGYGFALAVPGKYYEPPHDPPAGPTPRVRAWSPLFNFPWQGPACQIAAGVSIVTGASYTGYEGEAAKRFLSVEELEECRSIGHWLEVDQTLPDEITIRARNNCFLLALWLTKPTRTHLSLRFEEIEGGEYLVARILERFQWIEGQVSEELLSSDLARVRRILPTLLSIYAASRRLRNALVLTFRGCTSTDWQSSYICLTAAVEALLTCSNGRGLMRRLADSFALVTSSSENERKAQREHFKRLYSVRSEIMHGRSHDRRNAEFNLRDLAAMRDALRSLWDRILESDGLRVALEADDRSRATFFRTL